MKFTVFAMLALASFAALAAGITDREKLEHVRVMSDRGFQEFRQMPIDVIEYWSNHWYVTAIFYDLDGDGKMECLASTPCHQDRSHCDWFQIRKDGRGGFLNGYDFPFNGTERMDCVPWRIYEATGKNGKKILVGRDGYAESYKNDKRDWIKHGDFIIRTDTNFNFNVQFLANGIAGLVRSPDFVRLDAVLPETYVGFDLRLEGGSRFPLPGRKVGTSAPAGFTNYVAHYRAEVKRSLAIDRKVTVYAVFFDADNDGDADFYVSSDAEGAGDDKYLWTLYFADSGKFTKAETRYRYPPSDTPSMFEPDEESYRFVSLCTLEPRETARKDLFFRYVSPWKKPRCVVMDDDGTNLVPRIFQKYVSAEDRRRYPPVTADRYNSDYTRDDWRDDMHGKLGFYPPQDFMDLLQGAVSLERLPCEEFLEE